MVLNYYYHSVTIVNTVVCAAKNFWFFSLFFLVFCKWYRVCSYKLGVLGPWEFLWRAGSCIYSVLVSLFCEIGGPVQFYLVTVVGWTAGLYRFSFFSGSISVGTVRVKRWGVTRFSFLLQFAVCFLGGCISAVGICCVIFCDGSFVVFFGGFFLSFFFEVLIVNNLLQVVSQESEP